MSGALDCGCDPDVHHTCDRHRPHAYKPGPGGDFCLVCGGGPAATMHDRPGPLARGTFDLTTAPDPDAVALATPPVVEALSSQEMLRLGALSLQEEQSEAVEQLLTDQQATYQEILRTQGGGALLRVLMDRDRQLAGMGREIATGRTAGRLLREFVRGVLAHADMTSLRRVGDATKGGTIEGILQALGAEPADLSQLRKSGSTLGPVEDREERHERLADGRQKL